METLGGLPVGEERSGSEHPLNRNFSGIGAAGRVSLSIPGGRVCPYEHSMQDDGMPYIRCKRV